MSCESPFEYELISEVQTVENEVEFSGSYTLNSYSIPSEPICEYVPPYESCKWGKSCKWKGWKLNCSWDVVDCKWVQESWCCCWNTPSIELWPTLTFTASVVIPMTFESEEAFVITADSPAEPIITTSFIINPVDLDLEVNGVSYSVPIIPETITVEQENGFFDIDITLYPYNNGTISYGVNIDGVGYSFDITPSLLLCLNPEPPQTWINLLLTCSLSADYEGITETVNFSISCPIPIDA